MAAAYERSRPGYPAQLVEWLVPSDAAVVVDGGAGTGKLTGSLEAPERHVIAVDPDADMLAVLAAGHPRVETLVGRAEELPLGDGSADVLLYAQAWHWVDPLPASLEAARVLRPGGTLGLLWNIRDESVDWVSALSAVMRRSAGERILDDGGPEIGPPFGSPEHAQTRWSLPLTIDGLVELATSRSYVITAPADERIRLLAEIRKIGEQAAAPDGTLAMPYVTHAFRATRP